MTEAEKKMKKYTRAVNRKLNLPSDVKRRVMTDFTSSIQSRKEAGKTDEEIYAELGSPADVAADLNEQMKEFAYIKSPWRWVSYELGPHGSGDQTDRYGKQVPLLILGSRLICRVFS